MFKIFRNFHYGNFNNLETAIFSLNVFSFERQKLGRMGRLRLIIKKAEIGAVVVTVEIRCSPHIYQYLNVYKKIWVGNLRGRLTKNLYPYFVFIFKGENV